ncbi:MAG: cytochrome c oxidase subunit II [Myxococcales bacterium]|nr:cytochrome c oxidase subunit II [Myxococcales bacterium]MCB9519340.1 cytochrome c oxidase subunit II [Myxococcales bacterium]MCB9530784.1 cytochrome c oxidase subunit II [Myxococcales bacterium]
MQTFSPVLIGSGGFWMPPQASTFAPNTDALFHFILWLCAIFFAGLMGATAYFGWKYKKRSDADRTSPIRGNHKLEIVWSVIPGLLLLVIFGWGFAGYREMIVAPPNAINMHITGQKWSWTMTYPNGGEDGNRLVVPINEPVKLTMSSIDVIHSFFVPAFRVKRDVIPNRYTTIWFQATELGSYPIYCTEYCGDRHSEMIGHVDVVTREEYETYLRGLAGCSEGDDLVACGERQFQRLGCGACHSVVPGQRIVGPSLAQVFGHEVSLTDGTTLTADEDYLRQSIMDPNSQIVEGFAPQMPTFAGRLDGVNLAAVIEYIKSLQ